MNRRSLLTGLLATVAAPAVAAIPAPVALTYGEINRRTVQAALKALQPVMVMSERSKMDLMLYGVTTMKFKRPIPFGLPAYERVDPVDFYIDPAAGSL